jgi:hypothetical protein
MFKHPEIPITTTKKSYVENTSETMLKHPETYVETP